MKNYEEGDSERLSDIIVLTIISQVEIGPKVYGIFNDGVILAYHKVSKLSFVHFTRLSLNFCSMNNSVLNISKTQNFLKS